MCGKISGRGVSVRFTVFTPAYNRAKSLRLLYESLRSQQNRDFEWLIIDDGSTDDTASVTAEFSSDLFPIRYIYKENGGKHTAYNLALEYAQGEYFFCVDSDDYVAEGAMEQLSRFADGQPKNRGIAAYKVYPGGDLIGSGFPDGVKESTAFDLYERYGCKGDFAFIYPTEIAKAFPFPVFSGERFVTESVIFDRLDSVCHMALLPYAVSICEYMADGYSQNANAVMARNPSGYCLYFMQRIDLMRSFFSRLTYAGKYWCFRWICKNKSLRYTGSHKLLTYLSMPLGLLFRAYYKFVRGF